MNTTMMELIDEARDEARLELDWDIAAQDRVLAACDQAAEYVGIWPAHAAQIPANAAFVEDNLVAVEMLELLSARLDQLA